MSGKQFLIILIITFITIVIWVSLDILRSRSQVQTAPEVQELLEPINPNFDIEALGG